MSVAHDLQNIIGGISADIAARKTLGRVELEQLRRSLTEVATAARQQDTDVIVIRTIAEELVGAVETGVANLVGVAGRARARIAG